MELHRLAREFDSVAELYERGRPPWPPEAAELIAREFGLGRGDPVCDLAAGTGKLARELVAAGFAVVAVEPLESMRALLATLAGVEVRSGVAEATGLEEGSQAAICCGDAYHWFDYDRAVAEMARVLRPGGGVALLWHLPGWGEDMPAWVRRCGELLDRLRGEHPGFTGDQGRDAFRRHGGFTPFSHHTIRHVSHTDRAGMLANFASISYVQALPPAERERALGEFEAAMAGVEAIALPLRTDVWLTRRTS